MNELKAVFSFSFAAFTLNKSDNIIRLQYTGQLSRTNSILCTLVERRLLWFELFPSITVAMKTQARWEAMERTDVLYSGVAFLLLGTVLVVGSFVALGFTGTFLGECERY